MMKTLEQLKKELGSDERPAPAADTPNPRDLPYWVVVVNPRRSPLMPKYYFGYADEKVAEQAAAERSAVAAEQARDESVRRGSVWEPFCYHVIAKPEEGRL